jgi:amino acid transporter
MTPSDATGEQRAANQRSLRRSLGLGAVTSTSTGLAFAALEYLAAAGLVVYVAGDSAWIAIATAGLLALLAWGFFGELNGMYPTAAAIRIYMKRSMDDRVALTITFTYMLTIVLVIAADAFIVGSALAHAFGEQPWASALWIIGLIALAALANLRGVNIAAILQNSATVTIITATVVVGITAIVRSHHALRFPLTPLHGHSPTDFVEAVALGIFLFSGFEWVTTSSEEVRDPASIPRGMLGALGILFVACALVAVAMSHVLDHHELTSAYPQLFLGRSAFGQGGLWLMAAITAVTALNTFNSGFITASRFIYATAREGSLPSQLARLNARAVPYVPVLALAGTALAVALVVALTHSWQVLVAMGAALEAMIYAVAGWCTLQLRRRQPDHARPFAMVFGRALSVIGIVLFSVLAASASVSVNNHFDPVPLGLIGLAVLAASYYTIRVLPRLQAARAAARQSQTRRRPPRNDTASLEPDQARGEGADVVQRERDTIL